MVRNNTDVFIMVKVFLLINGWKLQKSGHHKAETWNIIGIHNITEKNTYEITFVQKEKSLKIIMDIYKVIGSIRKLLVIIQMTKE